MNLACAPPPTSPADKGLRPDDSNLRPDVASTEAHDAAAAARPVVDNTTSATPNHTEEASAPGTNRRSTSALLPPPLTPEATFIALSEALFGAMKHGALSSANFHASRHHLDSTPSRNESTTKPPESEGSSASLHFQQDAMSPPRSMTHSLVSQPTFTQLMCTPMELGTPAYDARTTPDRDAMFNAGWQRTSDDPLTADTQRRQSVTQYLPETSADFETVGKYLILGSLGRGQHAEVKRAIHMETQQLVAIKVLPIEIAASAGRNNTALPGSAGVSVVAQLKREQQYRELSVSLTFDHPHIVRCHEIIKPRNVNNIYLVMQLAAGGPAATMTPDYACTTKPISDLRRLARQAADALAYLHSLGVTHRDIKPDNFLLDANGNLLLSDFGTCAASPTQSSQVSGAIAFRAPEEFASHSEQDVSSPPVSAIDMWSLGVSLYGMTFGVLPFVAPTFFALRDDILTKVPSVSGMAQHDDFWVTQVILPLLEKNPQRRISAAELKMRLG